MGGTGQTGVNPQWQWHDYDNLLSIEVKGRALFVAIDNPAVWAGVVIPVDQARQLVQWLSAQLADEPAHNGQHRRGRRNG